MSVRLFGSSLACSLVALSFAAQTARAQLRETAKSAALELDWRAPAGCPEARAVRAEVLRLARLDSSPPSQLRATAEIRTDGQNWQLTLTTELAGISGERTLTASSCRALSDAATLTLALILNPDVERAQPEPLADSDPFELGATLSARVGAEHGEARRARSELRARRWAAARRSVDVGLRWVRATPRNASERLVRPGRTDLVGLRSIVRVLGLHAVAPRSDPARALSSAASRARGSLSGTRRRRSRIGRRASSGCAQESGSGTC